MATALEVRPANHTNTILVILVVILVGALGLVAAVGTVGWLVALSMHQRVAQLSQVPVRVATRQSITGPGLVAIITNDSAKTLSVSADFTNPTLHHSQTRSLILRPHRPIQIGYLEGWAFASGDQIVLRSDGYEPENLLVR